MKDKNNFGREAFKGYLASRLLTLISNFPMYYEKRYTTLPFSIDGIALATNTGDASFINTPDIFMEKKLSVDLEKDKKIVEILLEARKMILESNTSEKLKIACSQCGNLSEELIDYYY